MAPDYVEAATRANTTPTQRTIRAPTLLSLCVSHCASHGASHGALRRAFGQQLLQPGRGLTTSTFYDSQSGLTIEIPTSPIITLHSLATPLPTIPWGCDAAAAKISDILSAPPSPDAPRVLFQSPQPSIPFQLACAKLADHGYPTISLELSRPTSERCDVDVFEDELEDLVDCLCEVDCVGLPMKHRIELHCGTGELRDCAVVDRAIVARDLGVLKFYAGDAKVAEVLTRALR